MNNVEAVYYSSNKEKVFLFTSTSHSESESTCDSLSLQPINSSWLTTTSSSSANETISSQDEEWVKPKRVNLQPSAPTSRDIRKFFQHKGMVKSTTKTSKKKPETNGRLIVLKKIPISQITRKRFCFSPLKTSTWMV